MIAMKMMNVPPLANVFDAYKAKIPGRFKPDEKFYTLVGINRKRFGQLLRGDARMYTDEAKKLAEVLDVPVTDLL